MSELSDGELKVLKAFTEYDTVSTMAVHLNLSRTTIYNYVAHIRKKYARWRKGVNTIEAVRRSAPNFNRMMKKIQRVDIDKENETSEVDEF